MLSRNIRVEEDLIDQRFNSTEKTPGARASSTGPLWQERRAAENPSQGIPRNIGGDDRYNALPSESVYEQIQFTHS
jgi:hypothetical protein